MAEEPSPSPTSTPASAGEGGVVARVWSRFGLAAPLALLSLVMPPLGGGLLIAYMKTIAEYLRSHAESGPWLYATAFATLAGLALLPTYAQSALGGFAFGVTIGFVAALAGFVGGAIIGYEVARRASGDKVMQTIESKPQWKAVREAFVSGQVNGFWKNLGMVALLRVPPNSPFALTNLVMASVKVPRAAFVVGTLIGMAPRTAAAVWVGSQAAELTGLSERPRWMVVVGIIVSIVVLGVVGLIADRAIKRVTGMGVRRDLGSATSADA